MNLRTKIMAALAGSVLAVGAVATSVAYVSTANQLDAAIDDSLRGGATAVIAAGRHEQGQERGRGGEHGELVARTADDDCPPAGAFQPASGAQIVTADGTVTSCIEAGLRIPVSEDDLRRAEGENELLTLHIGGDDYRVVSTAWDGVGTLQIARSLDERNAVLRRVRLRLGALLGFAALGAAAIGWLIAERLVRPIVGLRDAARHIASTNDLSAPIDVRGGGEVGDLSASFATMIDALRRSQDQQRQLVSDASHEMRTPLTSLRTNLHLVAEIDRLPSPERREVVTDVMADVDELTNLLEELVDLAGDMRSAEAVEAVCLGDLARTVAGRAERRHGRRVNVDDAAAAAEVSARPRQIERAIANLVDNAIKYSEPATSIDVGIIGTSVTVADRGRGLPPGEEERIFERFYRAVEARSEPGSGLGLAIVAEIVRTHGGTVFARARSGGGSEVGFSLPGS